jgi:phosphatidate cytidylyltransferase
VTRVLSGAVLLALAIAVVWFAPASLFLLVAEILLVLACREYVGLARASRLRVPAVLTTGAAIVTCATFTSVMNSDMEFIGMPGTTTPPLADVLLAAFLMIAVFELVTWRPGIDAVGSAAAATLPSLYLALPIGSMIAIREIHGPPVLFLMMLTVFVSDSAQYYSGRAFGKHLLAPAISPKKTIEGAVGGFIFGGLFFTAVGAWWLTTVPAAARVVIGVAIVIAGIAGDLFESMLKRSAGVKDSSALIPGHGGILDRIDALLFAAPLYYIVLKYV